MTDRFRRKTRGELPLYERAVVSVEEPVKRRLFGCEMCGQCILSNTGYVCPMGCPKGLRNGPCGGTLDGRCEVHPEMKCVWLDIYDHRKARDYLVELPPLQAPVDPDLVGTSSYVNLLKGADRKTRRPVAYLDLPDRPRQGPPATGSRLERALKNGKFALTAEIHSPKSLDGLARAQDEARALAPFVDGINATSNAGGRASVSGLDAAERIKAAGGDPIAQVCGRDVGPEQYVADLERGRDLGLSNLLCLSGDWSGPRMPRSERNESWKTYFPMDSAQMIHEARTMRELGRSAFTPNIYRGDERPTYFIGGVINPYSSPPATVTARLAQKIACGAEFIQTQAVLDVPGFLTWLAALRDTGLLSRFYLLPSVPIILSLRSLDILASLPGVYVPEAVKARLMGGADAEGRCREAGLALAEEICLALRGAAGVDGLHLMIFGGSWTGIQDFVRRLRVNLDGHERPSDHPNGSMNASDFFPAGGAENVIGDHIAQE